MKKVLLFFAVLTMSFALYACAQDTTEVELQPLPDVVNMANLDEFMHRPDVQYTDLRNFDDQMRGGWIRGFEIIPFFGYLEYESILVREDGWNFSPSNILDENALRNLFDDDKYILLMCAAGARAGYVKEALEHLGYDNVYNLGALGDYQGDHKVFGDDAFRFTLPPKSHVDPLPEVITMADIDLYVGRPNMQFIDLRNFSNMTTDGWHTAFTVVPFFEFLEAENILVRSDGWNFSPEDIKNEDALRNIFDADKDIILICAAGARAGYVKAALEYLGYENVWNAGALGDYEGPNYICPWKSSENDEPGNGDCE